MEHDIEEICIKPDITAITIKIEPTATGIDEKVNEELSKNENINQGVYDNDNVNRISCPICDTTFKTRAYQKQHMKYTHPTEKDVVDCSQCNRSFRSIAHLRYHNRSVHAEIQEVTCQICQKTFQTKKRLVDHMYHSHPTPDETVSCEICKKSYKSKSSLRSHMRNMHVSDEDCVPCPHCEKTFTNIHILNQHVRRSHPADDTVYRCQQCDKTFPSKISYKDHIANVHTSKIFECHICLKTIKKNLARHMKSVHGGEKRVPKNYKAGELQCSHCFKRFVKKITLTWHIEQCHSKNSETNSE